MVLLIALESNAGSNDPTVGSTNIIGHLSHYLIIIHNIWLLGNHIVVHQCLMESLNGQLEPICCPVCAVAAFNQTNFLGNVTHRGIGFSVNLVHNIASCKKDCC